MAEEASYNGRVVDIEVQAGRRGVEIVPLLFCPLCRLARGHYFPVENLCLGQRSVGGVEEFASIVLIRHKSPACAVDPLASEVRRYEEWRCSTLLTIFRSHIAIAS